MIDVTAAIFTHEGRILAARRKKGKHLAGFWEFPGGKIEPGETPEQCLTRELFEELGIRVAVTDFVCESIYAYADKTVRLLGYRAVYLSGDFQLHDHDQIRWLTVDTLMSVEWAAADVPIVEELQRLEI